MENSPERNQKEAVVASIYIKSYVDPVPAAGLDVGPDDGVVVRSRYRPELAGYLHVRFHSVQAAFREVVRGRKAEVKLF